MREKSILLSVALWLGACGTPPAELTLDSFPAMGTLVEISIRAPQRVDSTEAALELRRYFNTAESDWYAWGDGELGRLNAGLEDASPRLQAIIAEAETLRVTSSGLFEPRIGALVELWGFHEGERPHGPPPVAADIQAWRDGLMAVRYDLGAYAKGLAVDEAREILRTLGVQHALVNVGGDLGVLGDAGGRSWRVGIRNPRTPGVMAGIEMRDGEAIFTSGDYERAFEWDSVRFHHILDPRTGYPADGTASMTVVHTSAAHADAAATALFVAGDKWPGIADSMDVTLAMRVRTDGGVEMTAAMQQRIEFVQSPREIRVIEDVAASR